jgi:hypothetical protein
MTLLLAPVHHEWHPTVTGNSMAYTYIHEVGATNGPFKLWFKQCIVTYL